MKKLTFLLIAVIAAISCFSATAAKPVDIRTYDYAIKGADTLRVDCYTVTPETLNPRPAVVFVFGGSFKTGDRAAQVYIPCFEFLARQGFAVFSIDYRTALANPAATNIAPSPDAFAAALQGAVDTAVEDLYDATAYIVANATDLGVDPQQIIASGSSAGAITVLQSEYYIANSHPLAARLPEGFNYAGLVTFAGAIMSPVAPVWASQPCPMMLFHGDADGIVPFVAAEVNGFGGLYGSTSIVDSLKAIDASYSFYIIENAGHEVATIPMSNNLYDIMSFLSRQALNREPLQVTTTQTVPGAIPVNKNFTILDYLRNNL